MGYKAKKKHVKLRFADDTDMAGLEVTMSSVSTGHLLRIQELGAGFKPGQFDPKLFHEMVEMFADALVEWNLENEDEQPVGSTAAGVLAQEPDFVMSVIRAWCDAIAGISAPLDGSSTSGAPALEASMPMETLSSSHLN